MMLVIIVCYSKVELYFDLKMVEASKYGDDELISKYSERYLYKNMSYVFIT